MEQAWYFVHAGESQGPVSGAGLAQLAAQGLADEGTLVWQEGMEQWAKLGDVPVLVAAVAEAKAAQPAAKRPRLAGGTGPPPPEIAAEVPAWADALDAPSLLALFERALFHQLEDAIQGRPTLRDALLTAYVQRHPASDDRDPASYAFADSFLLEALDDLESREEMWEVLGEGNEAAVRGLITAAAHTDRRYAAQLQNLALLSRARRLLAQCAESGRGSSKDEGSAEPAAADPAAALAALLREEPAVVLARDQDGRSLWHDLAAGEHVDLLRTLLPLAQEAATGGGSVGGGSTQQQNGEAQQQAGEQRQQQQQQQQAVNPLNLADHNGNTPLHVAAEVANTEVARLLLDAGASLDMQNRDPSKYARGDWNVRSRGLDYAIPVPSLHQTPLHIAAEACDLELLGLLAGRGALLDLRDTSGSTPLHLALEARDERAVELLLKAGANPALASNDMAEGATCLSLAAAQGSAKLVRLLLGSGKLGAAVNQTEAEQGFTPLMLAARRGSKECVELLLAAGADPAAKNAAGKTALDIALVNKRRPVVECLQQQQQPQQKNSAE